MLKGDTRGGAGEGGGGGGGGVLCRGWGLRGVCVYGSGMRKKGWGVLCMLMAG